MIRLFVYRIFIILFIVALVPCAAEAYSRTGCKWKNARATEYINTGGSPSGSLSAIQEAMIEWSNVNGSRFEFIYGGKTNSHAFGKRDGKNIIDFGSISGSYLGYCYWWYNSKRQTTDSDIRFNKKYSWRTATKSGRYDLRTVALHELGHTLGLGHSGNRKSVMYASYHGAQHLHTDDINGIKYLYPGPTTTTTTVPVSGEISGNFQDIISGDFDGDGRDDIAGIEDNGSIAYSTNLTDKTMMPGAFEALVAGDLDGDEKDEIVALKNDGWSDYHEIYYSVELGNWMAVPGRLVSVASSDFNGDGLDDIAGTQTDGDVWYTNDSGDTWNRLAEERFEVLASGDVNGDAASDIIALQNDGWSDYYEIYYSTDKNNWSLLPGRLLTVVSGDFNGDGRDDVAGLQEDGDIWYTLDLGETWEQLDEKQFEMLISADINGDNKDDLAGLDMNGGLYYSVDFETWNQVQGTYLTIISGDFNNDGRADIAGIQQDGDIWWRYSPDQ